MSLRPKSGKFAPRHQVTLSLGILLVVIVGALIAQFLISADSGPAQNYYVATNGSDANPGTVEAPFATIQKAKAVVREAASGAGFAGANVYVRGGEYELGTTLELTAADSGQAGKPISYLNYPGEQPIIRGSKRITGWSPPDGGKVTANLSGQIPDLNMNIAEVYLKGEKQVLAQAPNYKTPDFTQTDPYNAGTDNWFFASIATNAATPPALLNSCTSKTDLFYNYKTGTDITPDMVTSIQDTLAKDYNQGTDVSRFNKPQLDIFSQYDWGNSILDIAAVDGASNKITTVQNVAHTICAKNRYKVTNFAVALDVPGEWYQDKSANTLSYIPPKTLTDTDRVSVTVLDRAFKLYPDVHDVKIKGLTFEEFGKRANSALAANSTSNLGTVIMISKSTNIEISGNTIRNSAAYGIHVTSASNHINIHHNLIYNLAHGGIFTAPTLVSTSFNVSLTPEYISISDNTIYDVGYKYATAEGIYTGYTVGTVISHNEIYRTPGPAIKYMANDALIENNYVHDTGILCQDYGAIYLSGRLHTRGNIVRNNLIKNTGGYGKYNWWVTDGPMKYGFGTFGVYFDMSTGGNTAEDNIVVGGTRGCFDNNGGSENSFLNNICINSGLDPTTGTQFLASENLDSGVKSGTRPVGSMIGNWQEMQKFFGNGALNKDAYIAHYATADPYFIELINYSDNFWSTFEPGDFMVKNRVEYNIFYYPDAPASKAYIGTILGTDQTFNNNVFYDGPDRLISVSRTYPDKDTVTTTDWAGWTELGFDLDSAVSDPQFIDLANGNYNVGPASDATALGYHNIDISSVGPRDAALPAISIVYPSNGTTTLNDSITMQYVVDGLPMSKVFSGLHLGVNTLTVSASNPLDSSRTASASVDVILQESNLLKPEDFASGWNMVAFPDIQNGIVLKTLLPDTYRIQKFDNGGNNYLKSENVDITSQPGTGYWIKADDVAKITSMKYPVNPVSTVSIPTGKGWNLLGNPFQNSLSMSGIKVHYKNGTVRSFSEATNRGEIAGYVWSWESTASPKQYFFIAPNPALYNTGAQKRTYVGPARGFWTYIMSDQVDSIVMNQ